MLKFKSFGGIGATCARSLATPWIVQKKLENVIFVHLKSLENVIIYIDASLENVI